MFTDLFKNQVMNALKALHRDGAVKGYIDDGENIHILNSRHSINDYVKKTIGSGPSDEVGPDPNRGETEKADKCEHCDL